MKLPKFTKEMKNENPTPPWQREMDENDFISCNNSFVFGEYWDEFDKYSFACKETGDITYYVYDPIKHGADADKKYPVLMWIHGLNCAIDGIRCVGYCGAEQYASKKYQESMGGGAFLIVPLANEKRLEDDTIVGSWDEHYIAPVKALYDKVYLENQEHISCRFIMGASSGGYFSWRLIEDYPEDFDGAIPIASGYLPSDENLKRIEAAQIHLIVAHGQHDEMAVFDQCILPHKEVLLSMKNCLCYFPEWVRNADGGVSSVNYGMEMGQHCLINQFQENLIYDDGTYYDERLPEGVTGWIREVCEQKRKTVE